MSTKFELELKRRSKEYRKLLTDTVNEYNGNGKKTVLLTCDSYFPIVDGVVNVVDNYAKQLSKDMNVVLLVPDYKGKVYMKGYLTIGVKSSFSDRLNNQWPLPKLDAYCHKILKKLRIDVIHCHSPFTIGKVALKLHKKRHIPLVTTFHTQYKRDFEKHARLLMNFCMRYIMSVYNGSDEVWTMHTASRDTLISYGYKGKFLLMPNGTSMLPSPDYKQERLEARSKFLTDEDTALLIFVGRLVNQKNILFVVDVLAELKKRGVNFKMLFVGNGPDKEALEKKILAENLQGDITLLGQLDKSQIAEVYSAADLFLFPSLYDVSSLVQVEAASRYTPTVFVENSVTSCTVTNGVNGYIFPESIREFADGICNALQNKDKLNEISQNAYKDLYVTWDELVSKAKTRYLELIENYKTEN